LTAALLALAGAASGDDNFTCGEHIIESGFQKAIVLEYCGEPTERGDSEWIYDRGDERFLVVVHFDGDIVSLIEEVPRQ
jgi:hypothetical protein